jgi:putative phosphoesterase
VKQTFEKIETHNKPFKIGVLNDIHGNLIALNVVIDELERINCDLIISTGDMIAIGPYSKECLDRLSSLKHVEAVTGNHEHYYLYGVDQHERMSLGERTHQRWLHEQLSSGYMNYLSHLPDLIVKEINGKRIAFTHYAMNEVDEFVDMIHNPTAKQLDEAYSYLDADVICYGHIHAASDITGQARYINTGSLGCPHTYTNYARAGLLTIERNRVHYQQIEVPYDKSIVIEEMERHNMPEKEFIKKIFYGVE